MGEAKRKKEASKKAHVVWLNDNWAFEPTEWEAKTVSEIQDLPVVKAKKLPNEIMKSYGMQAARCHNNAHVFCERFPDGDSKHVIGWWAMEDCYVLHSIIIKHDVYCCVTPYEAEELSHIDFVPDAKIEWKQEGDLRVFYRDGTKIGLGVRINPEQFLAKIKASTAIVGN